MTAYHLLVVFGRFTGGDGLSALGPFYLHVSPRCGRLFSVWLWVLVLVVGWCLLALVLLVLLCLFSRCAPYAPSYISYDDSSHSEWALDFLFGTQSHWCCLFDSLLAKDCQYPRDPLQPAIKKKDVLRVSNLGHLLKELHRFPRNPKCKFIRNSVVGARHGLQRVATPSHLPAPDKQETTRLLLVGCTNESCG